MKLSRAILGVLLSLYLAVATFGQGISLAALLGKPIAQIEAALGKPRHVAKTGERYYKRDGFVRIVARFSAQKALDCLTFQFEPGTVKDEREALSRIGSSLPTGWASKWSAPGESENDELHVFKPALGARNFIPTKHFLQRMRERGVSEPQAIDLLQNGRRFWDPKNDSEIRWKDGIYVALTRDGVVKTVVRGNISSRWQPL
ncbi:MAG: DUF4258 domain-containing protein [Armatimonas sp.]